MKCTRPRVIYYRDPAQLHCIAEPMLVPCGKCLACRINKKREWKERIYHEFQISKNAYFVTLTYNEESLPFNGEGLPSVCKEDVQKFFKRLRKAYPEDKIRYFLNSEYGEKDNRPHYHCIIFNLPEDTLRPRNGYVRGEPQFVKGKGSNSMCNRHLSDIWNKGFVTIGYVTPERCGYTADYYVNKAKNPDFTTPNFNLMSRKPGIGVSYCEKAKDKILSTGCNGLFTARGSYTRLPRLYREHIYDTVQKNLRASRLYEKLKQGRKDTVSDFRTMENLGSVLEDHLESTLKFHNKSKL